MERRTIEGASGRDVRPPRRWRLIAVGTCATIGVVLGGLAAERQAAAVGEPAPDGPADVEGRALAAGAKATAVVAAERVLPALLDAAGTKVAAVDPQAELLRALGEAPAAAAAAYGTSPTPAFTNASGTTSAADDVLGWLAEARHHGLDWPLERRKAIAAEAVAVDAILHPRAAPHVEPATLAAAWEEAHGAGGGSEHLVAAVTERSTEAAEHVATATTAARKAAARLAYLEVTLATTVLELAAALRHRPRTEAVLEDDEGRYSPPEALWVDRTPSPLDASAAGALLSAAGQGGDALDSALNALLPQATEYRALVEASRRYAALCEAGGWPALKVPRHTRGRAWKDTEAIAAVQARLAVEGFYAPEPPTGAWDEPTIEGMKRYKEARQLEVDGTFEKIVAGELNVPCASRLATLRLNVRRWRHTARTDEPTYVFVNLPQSRVWYVRDGELRDQQRTVVGSGKWFWSRDDKRRVYPRASPLLTDEISQVVVNPSWTVPPSIVRQEFKPRIEKDPDYLEKNGYKVVTTSKGYEMVVQPPSSNHTLGDVKMLFPNAESIYLHDTNKKYYFRVPRRDLSHGCVRVHNALDFASSLLMDDYALREERFPKRNLHKLAVGNKTYWFKVHEPIPVFLEYYTASVAEDGTVQFHPDIYEYDRTHWEGPLPRSRKNDPKRPG